MDFSQIQGEAKPKTIINEDVGLQTASLIEQVMDSHDDCYILSSSSPLTYILRTVEKPVESTPSDWKTFLSYEL